MATRPSHVPARLQPVDQFDDAVVFQSEALRQGADSGLLTLGKAVYHQQQQILLGLKTRSSRGGIALTQEMANAIAKLGQCPELFRRYSRRHFYSIS
jgi:hypothetical protein